MVLFRSDITSSEALLALMLFLASFNVLLSAIPEEGATVLKLHQFGSGTGIAI